MESYIQTMEYCSTLRINELSSHEEIWRKLKYILLSERSQLKTLHTVYSNYIILEKKQSYGNKISVAAVKSGGKDAQSEHRGFFGQRNSLY